MWIIFVWTGFCGKLAISTRILLILNTALNFSLTHHFLHPLHPSTHTSVSLLLGDVILFGKTNMFRFNNPSEAAILRQKRLVSLIYIISCLNLSFVTYLTRDGIADVLVQCRCKLDAVVLQRFNISIDIDITIDADVVSFT